LISSLQDDALNSLKQARVALANADVKSVRTTLSEIEKSIEAAREISGENASEATMYRVLASMGLEQGPLSMK